MKRCDMIANIFKRYMKEKGVYTANNRNDIDYIINVIRSEKRVFNTSTILNVAVCLNDIGLAKTTARSILMDHDERNGNIISKVLYIQFYKFLKENKLFVTFIDKMKKTDTLSHYKSLREYVCSNHMVLPTSVFYHPSFSFGYDLFWCDVKITWLAYIREFLNEEI